jgi:hypothetical protein
MDVELLRVKGFEVCPYHALTLKKERFLRTVQKSAFVAVHLQGFPKLSKV